MTTPLADHDPARLREGFDRSGFVSIPDFVNETELQEIRTHLASFIDTVVPGLPRADVYYENRDDLATLKQIQQMQDHDPYFSTLLTGRFQTLAEMILGEPVVPQNLQYFNKPPGVGLGTPPHQDGYFFMLTPSRAATFWLALEDVGEEQGCVRYVEGSHRMGMRRHARSDVLGFSQHIIDYPQPNDTEHEIAFPCRAGHLIGHHSMTVHRADRNQTTDRTRQALGFIYFAASAREDDEAKQAYAQDLTNDLAAAGKI